VHLRLLWISLPDLLSVMGIENYQARIEAGVWFDVTWGFHKFGFGIIWHSQNSCDQLFCVSFHCHGGYDLIESPRDSAICELSEAWVFGQVLSE